MVNRLENYLMLLATRRAGRRRDATIAGAVFFLSLLAMLSLGLLGQLNGRSVYWGVALVATLGISFLMAWVKLQLVEQSVELINELKRLEEPKPSI